MRGSVTLGKILGISIGIHGSWLLIAGLITWSLASGYFPQEYPGQSAVTYWVLGSVTAAIFFASVLIHELGHSVVAIREGVPVRGITLFIFGGVAQIRKEPPSAGAEFRIAAAGPLTSLGLAGAFGVIGLTASINPIAAAPAVYLARINLLLALFNLIPGFPLDGGRVFRAILWGWRESFREATLWATRAGQLVAYGFILLGVGQIFFGDFLNGLWIAFIGWFLNNAAESSYQQTVIQDQLVGVRARDLMTTDCPQIPGDLSLDRLVDERIVPTGTRCFFVARNGELQGMVTLHSVKEVPRERWPATTSSEVMVPLDGLEWAKPDEEVSSLLRRMDEADVNQMPVMDDGKLLGMVTRERLLHYIRTRSDLGM